MLSFVYRRNKTTEEETQTPTSIEDVLRENIEAHRRFQERISSDIYESGAMNIHAAAGHKK